MNMNMNTNMYTLDQITAFSFELENGLTQIKSIKNILKNDIYLNKEDRRDLRSALKVLKIRTFELTQIIDNWINN